ncbi:DUF3304 domain-containing protein [Pseudoduganella sp.]|uniref:DUF3304 domain-containing protein n=1 Tax=Pseudoduganella sp. TaxID=1880898 RepID=UPI0035B2E7F4
MEVVGYNHSARGISSFAVAVGTSEREAGYIGPGQGGGSNFCCVAVPSQWTPGLKAKVTLMRLDGSNYSTSEQVVEIPKYGKGDNAFFAVHFLRDGRVKVFVTSYTLWHKNYPLKGKEAEMKPGEPIEVIN